MGAWSCKPFGNDTALDWLSELEKANNHVEVITNTLNKIINKDDVDSPEEEEAIAAVAVVSSASHEPIKGCSAEIKSWIKIKGFSPTSELKKLSLEALDLILIDSELRNSWEESEELSKWEKQLLKLKEDLSFHFESNGPNRKPKKKSMPRSLGNLVDYYLETEDSKVKLKITEKLLAIKDPNTQDKESDYDLAINIAAKLGFNELIELLIKKGGDPKLYSKWGTSSLTTAAAYDHPETIDLLLTNGVNLLVDFPTYDEFGNIASHRMKCVAIIQAMQKGSVELVKTLERHGASLQETDLNGDSLASIAEYHGNKPILEYLISRGIRTKT